ncbi:MAG: DUF5677 domain-containing protein [Burkholderiales bacterium]|nr:DUF5677 domain-containing protein [Burkholderiales bacterium]
MLFEWYKFVGALCNFFSCIRPDSPAVQTIPNLHYSILIGLLNRCSRLMLSNVALSHEGLFGETTALIDRCIFESCVKIAWLCQNDSVDRFDRFLADGIKTELQLKAKIESNIASRAGQILEIEKRMLTLINRHIASTELSERKINSTKKLPDMAAMIEGLAQDRIMYIVGQKIASHHIHGTWPSLLTHYLEENEDGMLRPRDHNCETHVNQYIFMPRIVLDAMENFVRFIFIEESDIAPMINLLEAIEREIEKVNIEVIGNDFKTAEEI